MIALTLAAAWTALGCIPQEEVAQRFPGAPGGWRDTVVAATNGYFYTIDRSGDLFKTDYSGARAAAGTPGAWKDALFMTSGNEPWVLLRDGSLARVSTAGLRLSTPGGPYADIVGMAADKDKLLLIDRKGALHGVFPHYGDDFDDRAVSYSRHLLAPEGSWKDAALMTVIGGKVWVIDASGQLHAQDEKGKSTAVGKPASHDGTRWMGPSSVGLVTLDKEGSLHRTDLNGHRRRLGRPGLLKSAAVITSSPHSDWVWSVSQDGTYSMTELIPTVDLGRMRPWNAVGLDQVKAFFVGLDSSIRVLDEASGLFEAKVKREEAELFVAVDLNADGRFFWLTLNLGTATPTHLEKAGDMLRRNLDIQPCQLLITSDGMLNLTLPVQNRGITAEALRKAVDLLAFAVNQTADLWDLPKPEKK